MNKFFLLLIIFQVKHFLADFPLQGKYMLGKFKREMRDWFFPLVAHGLVHASFTFGIVWYFKDPLSAAALAMIDFNLHCFMDRIKASPNIWGRYKIEDKRFWWALGFDQMFHHLTHYLIIGLMFT
jgi:hypothetical protein